MPEPKPIPGVGLAAQLLGEAVVAPSAADRVLRADPCRPHLEHGLGVVIQPPHEAVVHGVGPVQGIEVAAQQREVVGTLLAEVVGDVWRRLNDRLAPLDLAVQQAQRVALEPPPAIRTDLGLVLPVILHQHPEIVRAARGNRCC
jgi:hypothetical protein